MMIFFLIRLWNVKELNVSCINSVNFYLIKCNLTKLTTTSLAVKWFINLAVKRCTSLAIHKFGVP